jgi:kynurenine formamidase
MPYLIDCSIAIENDLPSDPPMMIPKVQYLGHDSGADQMKMFFPDIDPKRDLPDGKGWAVEIATLSTHSGTHLDAPWLWSTIDCRGQSPGNRGILPQPGLRQPCLSMGSE